MSDTDKSEPPPPDALLVVAAAAADAAADDNGVDCLTDSFRLVSSFISQRRQRQNMKTQQLHHKQQLSHLSYISRSQSRL